MFDELEGGLGKQRRNVLVTSLILLLYNLAGGQISNEVNVPPVGITLHDPERILYFLWVALAYFTWRYWLYAKQLHTEAWKIFERLFTTNEKVRLLMRSSYKDSFPQQYEATQKSFPKCQVWVNMTELACIGRTITSYTFSSKLHLEGPVNANQSTPQAKIQFNVPSYKLWYLKIYLYCKAFLEHKEFSDEIIPYLMVFLTFLAWCIKYL